MQCVYTMEGCPATAEIADENFKEAGLNNIKLIKGSFEKFFLILINQGIKPGLVFIDGNHRKEPVLEIF